MRAMVNKYVPFLFHPHVLSIVGAAFLPFLLGVAVYAEDINNRSDRGSILEDRLSTNRASAASSHSCLECKPGYAASSGEYEGKASGGTEDAEMAAMELDLSSGATSRTKEGSTSTPAFRCPETTPVTEALTGAGLINLFVSLGIVTVE